jgi:hypothetical protein
MKSIDDLRVAMKAVMQGGINFTLHLGVDDGNGLVYYKADLEAQSTAGIATDFLTPLNHWFNSEDLAVVPLSGIDQREEVLYHYDLNDEPKGFSSIAAVLPDAQPLFSFSDYSLADIKSIVIKVAVVGHVLLFFKHVYPVSLVRQSSILMMRAGNRLTKLDNDILKLTSGFDVLFYEDEYYINGFKKFEKAFKFDAIEQKVRADATAAIIALGICDDLSSHLANGSAPARDYIRVAKSDVLNLPAATILAHAAGLQGKTKLKIVGGKIQLTSKQSVKVFMKMLNDDYLRSGLTNYDYDTLAKNKL